MLVTVCVTLLANARASASVSVASSLVSNLREARYSLRAASTLLASFNGSTTRFGICRTAAVAIFQYPAAPVNAEPRSGGVWTARPIFGIDNSIYENGQNGAPPTAEAIDRVKKGRILFEKLRDARREARKLPSGKNRLKKLSISKNRLKKLSIS